MRKTELLRAVAAEFQPLEQVIMHDQVLEGLSGLTPNEALAQGVSPRRVWDALCSAHDVPAARRSGTRLPDVTRD